MIRITIYPRKFVKPDGSKARDPFTRVTTVYLFWIVPIFVMERVQKP